MKALSTYLNQLVDLNDGVSTAISFKYSMFMFALTGDNGDPMGQPSVGISRNPTGRMLFAHKLSTSPSGYLLRSSCALLLRGTILTCHQWEP